MQYALRNTEEHRERPGRPAERRRAMLGPLPCISSPRRAGSRSRRCSLPASPSPRVSPGVSHSLSALTWFHFLHFHLVSPLHADSDLGGLQEPGSEVRSLPSPASSKTSVGTVARLSYCCSEIKQHRVMQTYAREFKTGTGLPGEV